MTRRAVLFDIVLGGRGILKSESVVDFVGSFCVSGSLVSVGWRCVAER